MAASWLTFLSSLFQLAILALVSNASSSNFDERKENVVERVDFSVAQQFLQQSPSVWKQKLVQLLGEMKIQTTFNNSCSEDIEAVISAALAEKPEVWAMTMFDAFGKPGSAFLRGARRWAGSYSQCRRIIVQQSFHGEYCWAYLTLKPSVKKRLDISAISAKRKCIKKVILPEIEGDVIIQLAVCVPNTCADFQVLRTGKLLTELHPLQQINKYVNLTEVKCLRDHDIWENGLDVMILMILVILVMIVLAGTVYDVCQHREKFSVEERTLPTNDEGESSDVLLAFSAYSNGKKLLALDGGEHYIPAVHALRVISLIWIIAGHSFMVVTTTIDNTKEFVDQSRSFYLTFLRQATFGVVTFFFLSGFLVSYQYINEHHRSGGNISWQRFYFDHYWSLTPPYLFILGIVYIAILKYVGAGPFFGGRVMDINDVCKTYWWTNALYINNFMPSEKQCMDHSWFMAIDMQLHLLCPILLIPFTRSIHRALLTAFFGIIGTSLLCGFAGVINDLPLVIDYFNAPPGTDAYNDLFRLYYGTTYCHFGAYAIGMMTGWFLQGKKTLTIPNFIVVAGWTASVITMMIVIFIVKHEVSNNNIFRFVYFAFSGVAWSASIAWIVLACSCGFGGIFNRFLSFYFWNPLSRLAYCTYLLYPAAVFLVWGTTDVALHYSLTSTNIVTLANIIFSFSAAAVFSLLFEAPFRALKDCFTKRKQTTRNYRKVN